jgi:hypothetical protein
MGCSAAVLGGKELKIRGIHLENNYVTVEISTPLGVIFFLIKIKQLIPTESS